LLKGRFILRVAVATEIGWNKPAVLQSTVAEDRLSEDSLQKTQHVSAQQ
jgi:hypothetical protein